MKNATTLPLMGIIEEFYANGTKREYGRMFIGGGLSERLTAAAEWLRQNPKANVSVGQGETVVLIPEKQIGDISPYFELVWPETPQDFEQFFGEAANISAQHSPQ